MLQIPSVTQDDLYAFHVRVFRSTAAPTHLIPTGEDFDQNDFAESASEEVADDLGYYPGGVKRSLTDDQIAMFRHSEIYSILRERQVRKENEEADGNEISEGQLSDGDETAIAQVSPARIGEIPSDHYIRFKSLKSEREVQSNMKNITARTPGRNKRKRHSEHSDDQQAQGHTFRRTARELDSVMVHEQILDYGDDLAGIDEDRIVAPDITPKVSRSASSLREPTLKATTITQSPVVEGREIWWPTIGT